MDAGVLRGWGCVPLGGKARTHWGKMTRGSFSGYLGGRTWGQGPILARGSWVPILALKPQSPHTTGHRVSQSSRMALAARHGPQGLLCAE